MKIAITYKSGELFQRFEHTQQFKTYEVTDGKIVRTAAVNTNGGDHGCH